MVVPKFCQVILVALLGCGMAIPVAEFQDESNILEHREKRQIRQRGFRFENKTVLYKFSKIDPPTSEIVRRAIERLETTTCLKFREVDHDVPAFIDFTKSSDDSCFTNGRKINLADDCVKNGETARELLHSLDLFNSFERFDRDDYLEVENGPNKFSWSDIIQVVPFDYGSLLTYTPTGAEIKATKSEYSNTIGSLRGSFYDLVAINTYYGCFCPANLDCKNGGVTNPSTCTECLCPRGWAGKRCDELPSTNANQIQLESEWTSYTESLELDPSAAAADEEFTSRIIHISAPDSKSIEFQLTRLPDINCVPGCNTYGIEIKTRIDTRITSPLICCEDEASQWNKMIRYDGKGPLIIVLDARQSAPISFEFRARFVDQ